MKIPFVPFETWLMRSPDNDNKTAAPRLPTAEESLRAMRGGLFALEGGRR